MATLTEQDEFLDLLLADEDFVRAEFEAIIDGFQVEPPPARPGRPSPPSRRPGRTPPREQGAATHRPPLPERARQRSPPLALTAPARHN
jgi:hypothetical protein